MNQGKLPWRLVDGLEPDQQQALERLVKRCDFHLINLTESKHGKRNKAQNSRAWIKIKPVDDLPHNDVASFGSITRPWDS